MKNKGNLRVYALGEPSDNIVLDVNERTLTSQSDQSNREEIRHIFINYSPGTIEPTLDRNLHVDVDDSSDSPFSFRKLSPLSFSSNMSYVSENARMNRSVYQLEKDIKILSASPRLSTEKDRNLHLVDKPNFFAQLDNGIIHDLHDKSETFTKFSSAAIHVKSKTVHGRSPSAKSAMVMATESQIENSDSEIKLLRVKPMASRKLLPALMTELDDDQISPVTSSHSNKSFRSSKSSPKKMTVSSPGVLSYSQSRLQRSKEIISMPLLDDFPPRNYTAAVYNENSGLEILDDLDLFAAIEDGNRTEPLGTLSPGTLHVSQRQKFSPKIVKRGNDSNSPTARNRARLIIEIQRRFQDY